MRKFAELRLALPLAVCLGAATGFARSVGAAQDSDALALSFARTVVAQALTFEQGDPRALARVRPLFTDDGWQKFLNTLEGWLDPNGAPTFGANFVPSSSGRIVDEEKEVFHVRIPGSLTQMQDHARTTYRVAAADVWVGGSPLKVHRLTQTTCVGGSTACQ
jgi:hypothetical protein